MTAALLEIGLWFVGVAVMTVAVRRAFRQRETPRPAPRRNYDALAPHAPLYGARQVESRPLRPYTPEEQALIRTVWGETTIEVARPAAPERN